ncbi:MAG: endonuclease/exonuclease/phosphatase family protein [Candidatus Wildermuthbacteria bacterium]|nr:endonuclease/exonuclease/phosphatase family protein [Candidatus Wildermuthbacteria bacterium]
MSILVNTIFLNVAGGKWFEELLEFLKQYIEVTDLFCFQEVLDSVGEQKWSKSNWDAARVRSSLWNDLRKQLPGYWSIFTPYSRLPYEMQHTNMLSIGNAIFAREQTLRVVASWDAMIYRTRNSFDGKDLLTLPRNILGAELETREGTKFTVFNVHGLWHPDGKEDNSLRTAQARRIVEEISRCQGPKILGGDFNGFPNSQWAEIIEQSGMINLVRLNGITSTRSKHYPRGVTRGKHADNVFISREIPLAGFQVLQGVAVSDHLPLRVHYYV